MTFLVVLFYWITWCLHPFSHATVKYSIPLFLGAVRSVTVTYTGGISVPAGQLSVGTLSASHPRTLAASVQKKYLFLYIYVFLCFAAARLPNSHEKLTNLFIRRGHR